MKVWTRYKNRQTLLNQRLGKYGFTTVKINRTNPIPNGYTNRNSLKIAL